MTVLQKIKLTYVLHLYYSVYINSVMLWSDTAVN